MSKRRRVASSEQPAAMRRCRCRSVVRCAGGALLWFFTVSVGLPLSAQVPMPRPPSGPSAEPALVDVSWSRVELHDWIVGIKNDMARTTSEKQAVFHAATDRIAASIAPGLPEAVAGADVSRLSSRVAELLRYAHALALIADIRRGELELLSSQMDLAQHQARQVANALAESNRLQTTAAAAAQRASAELDLAHEELAAVVRIRAEYQDLAATQRDLITGLIARPTGEPERTTIGQILVLPGLAISAQGVDPTVGVGFQFEIGPLSIGIAVGYRFVDQSMQVLIPFGIGLGR